MKAFSARCLFSFCLVATPLFATDIVTLAGRKYLDVHDVLIRGEEVSFSTETEIVKLRLRDLPEATRAFYRAKQSATTAPASVPVEATPAPARPMDYRSDPKLRAQIDQLKDSVVKGLKDSRENKPIRLSPSDAFSLADLEKAKAKASREGKLLGFIMEWKTFFGGKAFPQKQGGENALAHFYKVFNEAVVLVFVSHESELAQVPDAVKKGFFGPDEGGFAPNMAVTDATATDFICEIPLGGGKSVGTIREKLFLDGAEKMAAYLISKAGSGAP